MHLPENAALVSAVADGSTVPQQRHPRDAAVPHAGCFRAPVSRQSEVASPRRHQPEVCSGKGEFAISARPRPVPRSIAGESDRPIASFSCSTTNSASIAPPIDSFTARSQSSSPSYETKRIGNCSGTWKRPSSRCRQPENCTGIGANTAWTAQCSTTSWSCSGSVCSCLIGA